MSPVMPEVDRAVAIRLAEQVRTAYLDDLGEVGAFLPQRVPADTLPTAFQPYLAACADLPTRYPAGHGGTRAWLGRRFDRLDPTVLAAVPRLSTPERHTLLTVLSILGHAYRWDTVPPDPARFAERRVDLPPGLEAPWRHVAMLHGQPRVGTTWSMHLCNWRMTDRAGGMPYAPASLTAENLRLAHSWLRPPADRTLERFSLTFVLMEAAGAAALAALVRAVDAAARADGEGLRSALDDLARGVKAVAASFTTNVRAGHVEPRTWLELVQPTFVWAAEVDGEAVTGPSGLQLGTVQCLDAALGVGGDSVLAQEARYARRYLPPPHRHFVEAVERAGFIVPDFVRASGDQQLRERFATCRKWLRTFRVAHSARGAKYLRALPGNSAGLSTGLGIPRTGGEDAARTFIHLTAHRIAETAAVPATTRPASSSTTRSALRIV